MKTLAFTLILAISSLLATAQSDTIFLRTGDTLVCEILDVSRRLSIHCMVQENDGSTWKEKIYEREILSVVTHKDLLTLSEEMSPGAFVRKSGEHLNTAGTLSLFSSLSVGIGFAIANSAVDNRIPLVLVTAGGLMGIASIIYQVSAGANLRKAGVLLDRVSVGISPGGAAVRYSF